MTRFSTARCVLTTVIPVFEVVGANRSVHLQHSLGSFRMNGFVLLPLQESMAQRGAGKHDQWRGYMTVFVNIDGIIKSNSILTVVIRLMIRFDVVQRFDCFRKEVKWRRAILLQLSTLSALDLDRVHHPPHGLMKKIHTYCLADGNQ